MLFSDDAKYKLRTKCRQISNIIIKEFNKKNNSFSRFPFRMRQDLEDFVFSVASNATENLETSLTTYRQKQERKLTNGKTILPPESSSD